MLTYSDYMIFIYACIGLCHCAPAVEYSRCWVTADCLWSECDLVLAASGCYNQFKIFYKSAVTSEDLNEVLFLNPSAH